MKISARKIAFTAIFAAFSVICLYLAAVLPTGQLGFLGVSSLFEIAAVCEYGVTGGILVLVVTAVLGFVIVPDKTAALLYLCFFGWYPLVKLFAEKLKPALSWVVKLITYNIAVSVCLFALKFTFISYEIGTAYYIICYALANVVYIVFDIAVSRAIMVYMSRIYPIIHKR